MGENVLEQHSNTMRYLLTSGSPLARNRHALRASSRLPLLTNQDGDSGDHRNMRPSGTMLNTIPIQATVLQGRTWRTEL
ncbi:unnamed protein product [Nesidiocoris tenuis]|uniref:Uncharacterized protein n=1 Tax=Nesidiocoris tenuis TaxID=355587 RepID=A0A6H5FYN9_9HEMI|nr:unnamed protein product [Nesidiocoris tenuis]